MARDRAPCVTRQAAVSRHGAGLGSRRAWGRWAHGWASRARTGRSGGHRRTLGARRAGTGRAGGAQARGQAAAARQALGLGARAGQGLCTRCTQPVFCPI